MDWLGAGTALGGGTAASPFAGREPLLRDVRLRLRRGQGFAVATLNLDHAVKLRADPAFRAAYAAHSHVTADGHPIVWLERLAGRRAERVPGADLVRPLACLAAQEGCPVALVGTTQASLDAAGARLAADIPGLRIAARLAPPPQFDPHGSAADLLLARLEASGARLCFLAMGAPRQEIFAARIAASLPSLGVASVGAGLDFVSGHQRRAPRLVQAAALEWLWRLARDPRRLGPRYALCAAALPGLALAAASRRRGPAGEGA